MGTHGRHNSFAVCFLHESTREIVSIDGIDVQGEAILFVLGAMASNPAVIYVAGYHHHECYVA